ncbi:basic proline-rich protein-like [Mustela erminea]|uniref:basic proline-rich protein-like n=1 Tax=Mustela erminea TaxID=36723 RepID=UPI0013875B1A|nr:basic proline-rich protein-like [Mustela erminea]
MPSESAPAGRLRAERHWLPFTDSDFAGTRQREREEPGTRGPRERRAARCRSPRAPGPREAGGEARLGQPATLRRPRAARSALEGPTAPTPPGEGGDRARPAGAADAHSARSPSTAATPSARRGVPASPRRPAGRPAATPGRMGKDEAQGPRGPRLRGARQRLKGGPRDSRRPEGRAPRAAIAPTPAPTPAPAASPSRPPPPSSPLLTSSPGGSARQPQGQISAAHSPRGGTQEPQPRTPSPPAGPCVPEPARDSPSRAAVLRSNQAALPPLSSALLYLLRSLPRSLAPTYLLISLRSLSRPPPPLHLRPQMGGNEQSANREKRPAPPHRPLPLRPPTAGEREGAIKKDGRGRSDSQSSQPVSAKGVGGEDGLVSPPPSQKA